MIGERLTGKDLKEMVIAGASCLEKNKAAIDALNVFPVPDGDTGTNMSMTVTSAAREVAACEAADVGAVSAALSLGALKGARGNSGVILSQIFRGFGRGLAGLDEASPQQFAAALESGVRAAYKAVMKPKEGTILTVAREMAMAASAGAALGDGFPELLARIISVGEDTLARTPQMLPVLAEAGVVDAGGQGLLTIIRGFKMCADGDEAEAAFDFGPAAKGPVLSAAAAHDTEIEFGYCTEFFITNLHKDVDDAAVDKLKTKLMAMGDSIVVVADSGFVKVHVHSNAPGKVLQYALQLGDLSDVKIENMREQHTQLSKDTPAAPAAKAPAPKTALAVVAVAAGDGFDAIFKDLGVGQTVSGGQSMNPSTEDIVEAIAAANARDVIVLPNNKNIILAAEQSARLTDSVVHVLPTKSMPQGITAMLNFNAELSVADNVMRMTDALRSVTTGEITVAVRPAKVNGFNIKKGETIGIKNGDIVVHGKKADEICRALVEQMVTENSCVISVYYGGEATEAQARMLTGDLAARHPDCDVDCQKGGQPVYDYIFAVE